MNHHKSCILSIISHWQSTRVHPYSKNLPQLQQDRQCDCCQLQEEYPFVRVKDVKDFDSYSAMGNDFGFCYSIFLDGDCIWLLSNLRALVMQGGWFNQAPNSEFSEGWSVLKCQLGFPVLLRIWCCRTGPWRPLWIAHHWWSSWKFYHCKTRKWIQRGFPGDRAWTLRLKQSPGALLDFDGIGPAQDAMRGLHQHLRSLCTFQGPNAEKERNTNVDLPTHPFHAANLSTR